MKCLETERLIRYAYGLMDGPAASAVRTHLEDCSSCRQIVEQHGRLDAVLKEWKAAEPTPGFDVRVRQAVEAMQQRQGAWRFWGRQWTRGLALAFLGVLLIAGTVWLSHGRRGSHGFAPVATRQPHPAGGGQTPLSLAAKAPSGMVESGVNGLNVAPGRILAGAFLNEDKDAQAMEDYDLAANFDLLSELPQAETRDAN
jgi:anti-sigma factor RsiW